MELVNKIAQSGLITLDLEDFFPKDEIVEFDIKNFLFRGLILKEIEFRDALKQHDWFVYKEKAVAIFCSTDAILPQWSFMLIASYLLKETTRFYFGTKEPRPFKEQRDSHPLSDKRTEPRVRGKIKAL